MLLYFLQCLENPDSSWQDFPDTVRSIGAYIMEKMDKVEEGKDVEDVAEVEDM